MALLWVEGFEGVGTATGSAPSPAGVLARKYPGIVDESLMDVEVGRLGGYCIEFNGIQYLNSPDLTTNATMVVGVAIRLADWPVSTAMTLLAFYDGATKGMNIRVTSLGELAVYKADTLVVTTSGVGISKGAWFYLEFKVVCGATGSYELLVGGVSVLSASPYNTSTLTRHTAFCITQAINNTTLPRFDDLYCLDGSGSVNNTFLGNQKVVGIVPNGDVSGSVEFTPSDVVDHYTLVNENPATDDTGYVEDDTVGHIDLWEYGSVSDLGAIAGVQINTAVRETDATDFDLLIPVQSNGTDSDGAAQAIGSTNYKTLHRVVEEDPDIAGPWTMTSINAARFGVKVG